mmetsp:Transcript_42948/g.122811  ORF Transcript_42948/g.122811 Transcript_42948/m.122811 type:complete len:229 (-) Transcript_42948:761-1447(-)
MRKDSLDWPQEKRGTVGNFARSSSSFLRFLSRSAASLAFSSASFLFLSSFFNFSSCLRFFRFSLSLRFISRDFSSSFCSFNRRSSRLFSCVSLSSTFSLSFFVLALASFWACSASLSTAIVSAAFLRPIISPTSTKPFSFFKVVIIFLIIFCLSSSALSTTRWSMLAWPMTSVEMSSAVSNPSLSDQCERLCFFRKRNREPGVAGISPVYRTGSSGVSSSAAMLGGTQ